MSRAPQTSARRRGEPAMALALLLGGWIGARVLLWEPLSLAMDQASQLLPPHFLATAPGVPAHLASANPSHARHHLPPFAKIAAPWPQPMGPFPPTAPASALALAIPNPIPIPTQQTAPPFANPHGPSTMASAQQMLWMAAISNLPLPEGLMPNGAALRENQKLQPSPIPSQTLPSSLLAPQSNNRSQPSQSRPRWSADGWLMWREGSQNAALSGAGIPSYGASQMGAVLRYRLSRNNQTAPSLYLRGTAALNGLGNGTGEKGVALGLSLRPIKSLPLTFAIETRADHFAGGGNHLRPAVMAIAAPKPIALPFNTRAEIYAQTGYVGGGNAGSPTATAFADGQFRLDHRIDKNNRGEWRAGMGLWGGAQRGTAMLDIGPSATIAITGSGSASARVAVDYRFRIAGNAAPTSGAAITLSAGF